MDSFSALDQSVRVAVYQSFVEAGNAPDVDRLSSLLGCLRSEIRASLFRLAAEYVLVLEGDQPQIRMAMPFSATPTPFRVTTAKGQWFANCAWDSLGIPAALGADARIDTTCADCGEMAELEIIGGNLAEEFGVIHFAIPAAHWWDDIRFT